MGREGRRSLGEQGVREVPSFSSTLNAMTEAVLLLQLHPEEMPSDHCCGMSVSEETESSQPNRMVLLQGREFPSQLIVCILTAFPDISKFTSLS